MIYFAAIIEEHHVMAIHFLSSRRRLALAGDAGGKLICNEGTRQ